MGAGLNEQALGLLDDAIAEAMRQHESLWTLTLCHHAAVIADSLGNLQLQRRYYGESLASNSENPRALYGLADVARRLGEHEIAKEYAARSYEAILRSDDEIIRQGLLDLVLKHWPELEKK